MCHRTGHDGNMDTDQDRVVHSIVSGMADGTSDRIMAICGSCDLCVVRTAPCISDMWSVSTPAVTDITQVTSAAHGWCTLAAIEAQSTHGRSMAVWQCEHVGQTYHHPFAHMGPLTLTHRAN